MNGEPLQCDLLVAGGGINGVAIARDAAGRGLRVVLCEQDDLAGHTSSASTKLIHGGLRYLEYGQIRLVRKALLERAVLLHAAPHLVRPLRLLLVHEASMRPAWMLGLGLWLYDHLAPLGQLPAARAVDLAVHPAGADLFSRFRRGFEFSDGWTDDARLVVTLAVDAAERGARILTRTRLHSVQREGEAWCAEAVDDEGRRLPIRARALVNATGPWAAQFLQQVCGDAARHRLRLVKGSHVIVRRRLTHGLAYVLQSPDRRIAFVLPYEQQFTLIGTTEVEFEGDPSTARIDAPETSYLLGLANGYLRQPLRDEDVVWSFSGVRPLLGDGSNPSSNPSAVTRDFVLEMETEGPPRLTVWGGKITTFRTLAEHAVDRLAPSIGCNAPAWTRSARLPGGDIVDLPRFLADLGARCPWLPSDTVQRLGLAYGTRVDAILGSARSAADLGEAIAPGRLYEAELEYLVRREWAARAQDVLWRRSKLGLHLSAPENAHLTDWFSRLRQGQAEISPLPRSGRGSG